MKFKHNKRRNTAFLYESLVRELIKSVVRKDDSKKQTAVEILKTFFHVGSTLGKELKLYKALYETTGLSTYDAEKLLQEAQRAYFAHGFVNSQEVYDQQSKLIAAVNKKLSPSVFSNFVPNYKNLATLQQIFSDTISLPTKVMLERKVIQDLCSVKTIAEHKEEKSKVSDFIIKTAVKNYNKKYESLLENQKKLITKFAAKNEENEAELRFYISEEMIRIKGNINSSLGLKEFKEDKIMKNKAVQVLSLIERMMKSDIGEEEVATVLKLQELEKELT